MRLLARFHIWLSWLIAAPLLLWTISGLVMAAKPVEETRGDSYRKTAQERPLPPGWLAAQLIEGEDRPVEMRTRMQGNSVVTSAIYSDGKIERYFARSGEPVPEIDMAAARTIVAMHIKGGDRIDSVTFYDGKNPPSDLRRAIPVWQVTLADGTHVYVGRESGAIEAIRTRWWRIYDTFRGLHIMDVQTREDSINAVLVAITALTLLMVLLGAPLLFRRHRVSKTAPATAERTHDGAEA